MFVVSLFLAQIFVSFLNIKAIGAARQCHVNDESEFPCDNGGCVSKEKWCNKVSDCSDSSDEGYCSHTSTIRDNYRYFFRCQSYRMYIPKVGICDGFVSCEDGSDEMDCHCDVQHRDNGIIEKNFQIGMRRSYRQCWKFVLHPNEQLKVTWEGKLSPRHCRYGNVTLFVDGSYFFVGRSKIDDSVYTICPVDMFQTTFTFINDVEIIFTSYYPANESETDVFKITYSKTYRDHWQPIDLVGSKICSAPPLEKQDDEVKDCENGLNEENCALSEVFCENSRKLATRWVRNQHDVDWGWKENTARAVVALYLSNDLNFDKSSHEDDLVAKQLELEVSQFLLRNRKEKAPVSEIAAYINALQAICHNPSNFYGVDLVKKLTEEIEATNDVAPFFSLILCNAKKNFSEGVVESLFQLLDKPADVGFDLEIRALASMALSCISSNDRYKHLKQRLTDNLNKIKKEQQEDGSFGDGYTTALVIQALIANSQANDKDWELKAAADYLRMMQKPDGSFGDFLMNYFVMPAMNGRSLVDLGRVNCTAKERRSGKRNPASSIKNRPGKKISVTYYLVIGDEKDQMLRVFLTVPERITVLELMTLAADIDPKYKFKTHQMKEKTYVYEISSIPNDPEKSSFWFLFRQVGDKTILTSTQSPDEVIVEESDHIMMWYRSPIKESQEEE